MSVRTLFISYRMKFSDEARLLAGFLKHSGIDIWFAEDQIALASQYDLDTIEKWISIGIDRSSHAILLTDDSYPHSEWCVGEAKAIVQRLSSKRIARIRIGRDDPLGEIVPELKHVATFDIPVRSEFNLDGVSQFLKDRHWSLIWRPCQIVKVKTESAPRVTLPGTQSTVDLSGWEKFDERKETPAGVRRIHSYYQREILEQKIQLCVTVATYSSGVPEYDDDDRLTRDRAVHFANEYVVAILSNKLQKAYSNAVHLTFVEGRGHFGMTYAVRGDEFAHVPAETKEWLLRNRWDGGKRLIPKKHLDGYMRIDLGASDRDFSATKYVVVKHDAHRDVEIIFTFLIPYIRNSELSRLSPLFLSVVHSLDRNSIDAERFYFGLRPKTRWQKACNLSLVPLLVCVVAYFTYWCASLLGVNGPWGLAILFFILLAPGACVTGLIHKVLYYVVSLGDTED